MRVITGSARGRKLVTPEGFDTRPTTDMVKEAIFSAIQFELPGAKVLDLFAGSGQLGIEALSRGASECVFVDNSAAALNCIRQNIKTTGFEANSKVFPIDSFAYVRSQSDKFDIILLDPPYSEEALQKLLPDISKLCSENALVICEHDPKCELCDSYNSIVIKKRYKYGKISVSIYKTQIKD
ncbi:MAG: 16S rRNA (guanine(966)-N(2))-methyltransferase RsmD [Oscillospiraceae bacterium]|nr:16S rRNA (guanine(966)-N(2))-methyltransferase RsmD [Oscillospiraceae bacterium]